MELSSPLEDSIRHELSSRDPAADDWLWLQQHPLAVTKFVKFLEGDSRFVNITSTYTLKPSSCKSVSALRLQLTKFFVYHHSSIRFCYQKFFVHDVLPELQSSALLLILW